MSDDDLPPSRQPPWWQGQAKRDYVFLGFLIVCVIMTIIIFIIVVWGM